MVLTTTTLFSGHSKSISNAETSGEKPVIPQWALDQTIDVDEAIQGILEKRNK